MSVVAQTYDKYVYSKVKVTYVPFAATGTNGQIYMYIDRDYLDPLADPNQPGQIMSTYNSVADQPWKPMSTSLDRDPNERRTYFTLLGQAQLPETEQFRVVVYATLPATYTGIVGQLYVEYDLSLIGPNFAPAESVSLGPTYQGFYGNFGRTLPTQTLTLASTSSSLTASAAGAFGVSDTNAARVWEVVCADWTGYAGQSVAGLTWGRITGPTFSYYSGQTFFLARAQYTGGVGNVWNVFQTYEAAMSGDASIALYNSSGLPITLMVSTGAITFLVRQLTFTPQAAYI